MKKKILVVDNHPMILRLMANFLSKEGHQVMTAEDGLAALNLLESFTPDIAFVDLVMPNISGDKLCRIIRSMPRFNHLFIVILSAIATEENIDYKAFGANACIPKGSVKAMQKHVLAALQKRENILDVLPRLQEDGRFSTITRELLSSKKHYEAIVNNMSEGVFELTPDGTIVFANLAATEMCGIAEERLLASNFSELFAAPAREKITAALAGGAAEKEALRNDAPLSMHDRHVSLQLLEISEGPQQVIIAITTDISERYESERALLASETRFRELFNSMSTGVAVYEAKDDEATDFIIVDFNQAATRIEKTSKEKIIGRSLLEIFPGVADFGLLTVLRRVRETGVPEHHPVSLYRDDRIVGWRENYVYRLPSGEVVAIFDDVTARRQAENELAFESALNEAVARISRMIISADSLDALSGNLLSEVVTLTGSRFGMVGFIEPGTENLHAVAFSPEMYDVCNLGGQEKAVIHKPQGLLGWILENRTSIYSNAPDKDPRAKGIPVGHVPVTRLLAAPAMLADDLIGVIALANSARNYEKKDLATVEQFASLFAMAVQKKWSQDHIARLAHHDSLTGAVNRHLFPDRLAQAMISARRQRRKVALFYLDLDNFKPINDTHGHLAGDAVLREVTARLHAAFRASDTVARMGGDEFAVIGEDLARKADALAMAEKIVRALARPVEFKGTPLAITASIGISIYPDDDRNIDSLLQKADEAMYRAKKKPGTCYEFHGA